MAMKMVFCSKSQERVLGSGRLARSSLAALRRPRSALAGVWLMIGLGLVLGSSRAWPDARFYVATNGNDQAAGSRQQPFASLERARDAARHFKTTFSKRIVVRGGKSYNVCLVLGPEDSGLTLEGAPGETPILYGGQPITGWVKEEGGLVSAPLPPLPTSYPTAGISSRLDKWEVRMLLVDGKAAPMARLPAEGTLTHATTFSVPWLSSTGGRLAAETDPRGVDLPEISAGRHSG